MYTAVFVTLYLFAWGTLAFLPWLGLSVATKGRAGLWLLPLCLFSGIVAALVVPFAGATGWGGLWGSFAAAILAPAGLLVASRLARLTGVQPETASSEVRRP
ncbi:hypothetical protein [Tepidiforma sp.]|uniref:hypothetical protein n=1 Tax=Tepidiforma sp. TaxID=2682230 RepID=UPI002ADE8758|nr:hypothetical protein [Tepidiforma sp.]